MSIELIHSERNETYEEDETAIIDEENNGNEFQPGGDENSIDDVSNKSGNEIEEEKLESEQKLTEPIDEETETLDKEEAKVNSSIE